VAIDKENVREMYKGRWQGKAVWTTVLFIAVVSICCKQQSQIQSATPSASSTPVNLAPLSAASPIIGKPYPGRGIVKLINRQEGWIEIDHEEIVGLMPPMEMEWFVEKKSLLNNVKVGDKVNFTVVETGKGEIITELRKADDDKK
jgi:Cu/Ag efflux protein CusF